MTNAPPHAITELVRGLAVVYPMTRRAREALAWQLTRLAEREARKS